MSLIKAWAPYFTSSVRLRGRQYQAEGRVHQAPPQAGELARAVVEGTRDHQVVIRGSSAGPSVACSCSFFASGQYCKHVWAVLLDVHLNGLLVERGEPAGARAQSLDQALPRPPKARRRDGSARPSRAAEPDWIGRLVLLRPAAGAAPAAANPVLAALRQICFVVEPVQSLRHGALVIEVHQRQPSRSGWARLKPLRISPAVVAELPDPADRELCALLLGADPVSRFDWDAGFVPGPERQQAAYRVLPGAWRGLLRRLIDTGRCFLAPDDEAGGHQPPLPLRWDGDPPWVLWLRGVDGGDELLVHLELRRGDQRLAIERPALLLGGSDGLVFYDACAAPFDDREAFTWAAQFRDDWRHHGEARPLRVPLADLPRFFERLYHLPNLPEMDWPAGVGRAEQRAAPQPHLELHSPSSAEAHLGRYRASNLVLGRAWFAYGPARVRPGQPGQYVGLPDPPDAAAAAETASESGSPPTDLSPLVRRDLRAESLALAGLVAEGFRVDPTGGESRDLVGAIPVKQLAAAVQGLLARGWAVTADRAVLRRAATPSFAITSGVDWFELRGGLTYTTQGGRQQTVPLPDVLAAAREGRSMVRLDDGSEGLIPEDWLRQHGLLASLGEVHTDHLRFKRSQAALLDTLLARQELVQTDDGFEQARQRLRSFEGLRPLGAGPGFHGLLRPYQCDGLGWLRFLREFGFGGILADDMGLGKTVQVLAMLEALRQQPGAGASPPGDAGAEAPPARPTLVVAPRSVVFNWLDEAQRFTPGLRVVAYSGAERGALREAFHSYDVVVTTYGLMRRDAQELRGQRFGYVILDEAQAIKNPASQVAKAARLLQAEHHLALTGTPVENHLGDLWSIFEFLNPGMLGSAAGFGRLIRQALHNNTHGGAGNGHESSAAEPAPASSAAAPAPPPPAPDPAASLTGRVLQSPEVAAQLGQALKPFILRRTKKQVLHELPPKTEQTIVCEMEPAQRQVYDELLRFYRANLLAKVDALGLNRATFMVLEALLRLRQAACHPALIDPRKAELPSAKVDALLEQIEDLIAEGHKALVFSQFTSFLALVRQRLDGAGVVYEYLDGQTRRRRERVQRFQTDPACPLFLISLKAGGLGLNLTAAEYVFILDPWWNPAVENQAIDRAHRIGQSRHVFAYRLICRDTVEQRIVELQEKKKQLAEAIVGQQANVLRTLTRDDLEKLLS